MTDEYSTPPAEVSDVQYLMQVCQAAREGPVTKEVLRGETDLSKLDKVIRYGLELGFLEKEEDQIVATKEGMELSYSSVEDAESLFQTAVADYQTYSAWLETIYEDVDQRLKDEGYIPRSEFEKELRTSLGIQKGDYTIKSASTLFLRTLDVAGVGEFVSGRGGGLPARIEVSDDYKRVIEEVLGDANSETSEETHQIATSTTEPDQPTPAQRNQQERSIATEATNAGIGIDLSIDGSDDPDNVEELIVAIRRGLTADIETDQESESDSGQSTPDSESTDASDEADNQGLEEFT